MSDSKILKMLWLDEIKSKATGAHLRMLQKCNALENPDYDDISSSFSAIAGLVDKIKEEE